MLVGAAVPAGALLLASAPTPSTIRATASSGWQISSSVDSEIFRQTLVNTFIFTIGSQIIGLLLGKFGAMLLMRQFPGRGIVAGADHAAVGGAGVAGDARLAVDVRFALQRDQLDAGCARPH